MVGYDGSVKVLDFGIAKAEERATKTVGGTIKGKYGYMSPEQCKGKPIDRRSDIFALGICLYEMTTLRRAFKGNDDFETMKRIVAGDMMLPSVAVPGYPRELEAIILTAMANDPNARFQSGQEMIEALDAFAVRAKLTGSNTAMGRFMVQLFGSRKEQWVEGAEVSPERTQVTAPSMPHEIGHGDKTAVLDERDLPRSEMFRPQPVTPPPRNTPPEMGAAAVADWQDDDSRQTQRGTVAARASSNNVMKTTLAGVSAPPRPSSPSMPPVDVRHGSDPGRARTPSNEPRNARPSRPPIAQAPASTVKIRSYGPWIVLAVLMALGVVAGVAIAVGTAH